MTKHTQLTAGYAESYHNLMYVYQFAMGTNMFLEFFKNIFRHVQGERILSTNKSRSRLLFIYGKNAFRFLHLYIYLHQLL